MWYRWSYLPQSMLSTSRVLRVSFRSESFIKPPLRYQVPFLVITGHRYGNKSSENGLETRRRKLRQKAANNCHVVAIG